MITRLDHIQLALPAGAEDEMRAFYCDILKMRAISKPMPLQDRGGFWAQAGGVQVHFGIDPTFHAATKAHPAFIVADIAALAKTLAAAGFDVTWDTTLPDVQRFFTSDPVGNRVELIAER